KLATTDLLILVAYLAVMVVFGSLFGRKSQDLEGYTVGGRDLPWWALLLSIVATETSTVTFLSIPGFAYRNDLTWLQLPLGYMVGRLLVVFLLLPHYFQGRMLTAYEMLHRRFGGGVKTAASAMFLVTRTLADGLRLFLGAIILHKVANIDLVLAIVCLGMATIVYTFLGGMRAVVWTDCLQFLIYMVGAAIAFGVILDKVPGGWSEVAEIASSRDKLRVFDFTFTFDKQFGYVFWGGLIGGALITFATHGADQMFVQRYLSARSQKQAGLALALSGPVVFLQFWFFLLVGIALFAFYQLHPPAEPLKKDHEFASFIVDHLPIGVTGVVLGAVFSAAMSTLSSSLNSTATALVNDIWVPYRRPQASEPYKLKVIRIATIVFGCLQIQVAIAGQGLKQGVIDAVMQIAGFTTGIILGVFFLGIFTRRVQARAALWGFVLGLGLMTWVSFATNLAWPWFALVGSGATFLFGLLAHLVLSNRTP
ncbi:MAG: sodium:solute symporter, partial [Planctomycetota bacterium]